jgi:ornithine cyclodeaminase/alanine dehydrogenase-like protein (mu-crystallin family)
MTSRVSSAALGRPYEDAVVLSDADVAELVSVPDAMDALELAFRDEGAGRAQNMQRTRAIWDDGRMQSLGGYVNGRRCAAVKSWVVTPNGAQPTVLLFSTETGRVLAIMEAAELGRIRTGAATGVAVRHLAPPDARVLLLIGTGRQAMAQVAAVAHVRSLTQVAVAGRDPQRTAEFAERVEERFGIEAEPADSIELAAGRADIITAVTNARAPVLLRAWVRPGTMVNAVGAVVPKAIEVDPALFGGADRVVVDSPAQAMVESAEIGEAVQEHGLDPDQLIPLHAVIDGRDPAPGITVFKSLGVGVEDAAVAELAWRRHQEHAGAD